MGRKIVFDLSHGVFPIMEDAGRKGSICRVCVFLQHILDMLDVSASAHMPDTLEMPYRPPLLGADDTEEDRITVRLGGPTCLSGDVIGDYSFDKQIHVGDKLYFQDMAIYSMVKNNTFNGSPLPGIAVMKEDGDCEMIRTFGYEDFKGRLA